MSQPSPQEFRETVRSQTDIVSLIGETISLQPRRGGEFAGLCPFHDDRNPSLRVYAPRQTFRCWSCNTGGDCFTFIMEREKITFPEALEILARRANLPIPKRSGAPSPTQDANRPRIFEVLQWAENQFHDALLHLPAAEPARRYLKEQRGFTDETITKYRLGFHPDDWSWLVNKSSRLYSPQLLMEARLIGEKSGRHFDFFVNRVIFPIHNERGQPVSFGGRILPGSQDDAKYWNGPESSVFHKSRLLYAIDKARDVIGKEKRALVVEGYTDCITCHQHGLLNVVGTLGTALTDSHVTALKRFAREVVLVFDGDEAGRKAALKAVERFLAQDVDLRILTLPGNLDPAEFLEAHGADEFRTLAAAAPEAWEYKFRGLRAAYGIETIDGRQRILDEMLALLAQLPSIAGSLRESLFVANLSQRLMLSEQGIRDRLKEVRSEGAQRVRREVPAENPGTRSLHVQRMIQGRIPREIQLECDLLEMTLAAPEHIHTVMQGLSGSPLRSEIVNQILTYCLWEDEEMGQITISGLLGRIDDPELKSLLVWIDEQVAAKGIAQKLSDSGLDEAGCPQLLRQAMNNVRWREAEQQLEVVEAQLSQGGQGATPLDSSIEALLMHAQAFHKQRATRNSGV